MARVKISEYKAKRILFGEGYSGVQLRTGDSMDIPGGRWVAKVDQGVKKRFKQGLVSVDKPEAETLSAIAEWEKKGFTQFILEPYFEHKTEEEQYLSLERVRDGVRVLHASDGGVNIEEHPEAVGRFVISEESDIAGIAAKIGLPEPFLLHVYTVFNSSHFSFLEINPLIVRGEDVYALDAAVLVDSAAEFFASGIWSDDDVVKTKAKHVAEERVEALAATTPAALKLSVINPDGALFFLLSGGGGSIVIADEAQLEGVGHLIANYGEYSGGPTREETYLYSKEIIGMMIQSKAQKKALVIAGGVANFTDVKKTFLGIIDALKERSEELRSQGIKIFVRRGGPNEKMGLQLMRDFLQAEGLLGAVYGSDVVITQAVDDAIQYIRIPAPLEGSQFTNPKS